MKATYLNHYLTDQDVANFARQSFAKLAESFTKEQNNTLIRFLARGMASGDWLVLTNKLRDAMSKEEAHDLAVYMRSIPEHWVPFGHPQVSLRMQAPVPIRVQCFKHKIGFVESEESRRYIQTTPEVFVPPFFRAKAANVKQGSGDKHHYSDTWLDEYRELTQQCVDTYSAMVGAGICPEQARFILPQGCEVNWVWTGSLYAFANFYNQRSNSHAQKEIQQLAAEVDAIINPLFPVSWGALTRGQY